MSPKYKVEILDKDLNEITQLQAFHPLDNSGNYLQYSDKLSDWGKGKFRVATHDLSLKTFGNIFEPFKYHVRITRYNSVVWQGVIINNPSRNKRYIEVEAHTYLYLLSKVLIRHDTTGDVNYRTFNSGTMAGAIQQIIVDAKADAGGALSKLALGSLENPTFPTGFVDFTNAALTGTWTFSNNFVVKFDYRDALYAIQSLGVYAVSDFQLVYNPVDNSLTFNFKKFLGNKQTDMVFEYSNYGSITDFNSPLRGDRMANNLTGVAADNNFNILKLEQSNSDSIAQYGKIQGVAAYIDVKDKNLLNTRLSEELKIVAYPDTEVHCTLNDRAYPLGQYGIGDIVRIKINDGIIQVNQLRRITGIDVKVAQNGDDTIRLITNPPRPDQI